MSLKTKSSFTCISRTMLLGKVLRLDINYYTPTTNYAIPPDNPFLSPLEDGTIPRPEIYAYGVRNIWRCGMDRGDPKTGEHS